jgi:hypothetical protein
MGFSDGGMAGLGFVDGSRGVWGSTVADVSCMGGSAYGDVGLIDDGG